MKLNLCLLSDSYKVSHWKQVPKGTTRIQSYPESRGGKFSHTLFQGLQPLIYQYLCTQVTHDDVNEAMEVYSMHFGSNEVFNEEGWRYIVDVHNGFLPLKIRAVEEGTVVPVSNALMSVVNTDVNCAWLTNWFETLLLHIWYPTTVATQSMYIKKDILESLERTGTPELIDFKLHDFGYRGVSSDESAGVGGLAHLVNFQGTDNISAIRNGTVNYRCNMAGYSIPAMEHNTVTIWGRDKEVKAYRNHIEQFGNMEGLAAYAIVIDSYDPWNAITNILGGELKDLILNSKNTLVFRPDSGDPPVVVVKCLELIGEAFGYTVNSKGYKVLHDKTRLIQGDGISYESIKIIIAAVEAAGWSMDNVAFGMGGELLQTMNRDTQKFAFKCSAAEVGGEWRDVYKDPITSSMKASKRGRLTLIRDTKGRYSTQDITLSISDHEYDMFRTVYENGQIINPITFDQVRINAAEGLKLLMNNDR